MLLNGSYFKGGLDWKQTSRRYATSLLGYSILIALGILFVIGLILTGCIVFSCRCCCGKCGGRLRPMESKRAKCRRVVYGILLTLFATLMLCGLVLAFISNQLAHNALDNSRPDSAPKRFAQGMSGAAAELGAVPRRARNASSAIAIKTVASLTPTVHSALVAMRSDLIGQSGLANRLADARQALASLNLARNRSNALLANSSWPSIVEAWARLNATLADLLAGLPRSAEPPHCPASARTACDWLLSIPRSGLMVSQPSPSYERSDGQCTARLPAEIDNPALDDGAALQRLLNDEPAGFVPAAMAALDKQIETAKSDLNSSSDLDRIWSAAETAASNASAYLKLAADSVSTMIINPTNNAEQSVAAVMTAFDLYRYYLCIGLACLALLIVAFYFLGLAFGFCGEPPYEDARCCNKGFGANLLLTGTGFAFIFGWLIMLFVMAFFVTGAVLDTEVCRHLTGRAGAAGYEAMDAAAAQLLPPGGLSRYTGQRLFSGLFGECADAAAAGKPASFASALNLSELVRASSLESRTEALADRAAQVLLEKWSVIVKDGFTQPDTLANNVSGLGAAVELAGARAGSAAAACAAALSRGPLTDGLDAQRLVAAVKQLSDAFSADASADAAVRARWSALSGRLSEDLQKAVAAIADKRGAAADVSAALSAAYTAGRSIADRLNASARVVISNPGLLNASLVVARANLSAGLAAVIRSAVSDALNSAADCATLGGYLRQAVQAPCVQLLQPLNGYWAGQGLFLLCLIPALVLACKLANLYRKTAKYQKDYQEPHGKPKRRKPSGSREKSRASQQLSAGAGVSGSGGGGVGGGGHHRDSGVSAVNRQSQRYSQLPPYAQEAYDY